MASPLDPVLRAVTNDGAFRVIVADTTHTSLGAVEAQACDGPGARALSQLLTSAILFREAMAPDLRVQIIVNGCNDSGALVADSAPEGLTRGLLQRSVSGAPLQVGPGSRIQLIRTLTTGQINQGVVELTTASIADAVMLYMHHSEQVVTMVGLGTQFDGDKLVHAGGYMVQALPEAKSGPMMLMSERLADFVSIDKFVGDASFTPKWLMDELLYGMPFTVTAQSTACFSCWCSEARLLGALSTLDRKEIEAMVADANPVDIGCDYCGKHYQIAPSKLSGLLTQH
jgi:molecular chaperone Hsp33